MSDAFAIGCMVFGWIFGFICGYRFFIDTRRKGPSEATKKTTTVKRVIFDHAYVSPGNGKDACAHEKCYKPKLDHEWTVGEKQANPSASRT
jgi:hypothetical protein